LLVAAKPAEVLGAPVGEPSKRGVYCGVSTGDASKSASLILPYVSKGSMGMTRERFFELQKEGLDMMGLGQDDLHQVDGLGSFAVYADHELGVQLWVFWGEGYSAIINLNGVNSANGLDWTKSLARSLIEAT
jgi:hypothetical protein